MKSARILYLLMVLMVTLSGYLSFLIYSDKHGKDFVSYEVSILGFCIATLALFISIKTFTSIDSVNSISKMEGNILDNENYVTSVPELIQRFTCKNEKELEKELFKSIEHKLNNESDTAVQFADTLQYMIDLIVFFPAVFNANDIDKYSYRSRMNAILKKLDKKRDELHSLSKGNSIQINETIKLFKGVISYQKFVADGNFNIHGDLLQVRGPILRNSVTKTIYHNYLGLYYNKKGMHLIRKALDMGNSDVMSISGISTVIEGINTMQPDLVEDTIMYLDTACKQFEKALSVSGDDTMWPGFIEYNRSRTLFFLSLLRKDDNPWLPVMNDAISARSRLNRLIDEVLTEHETGDNKIAVTHLRNFFMYQEELARLVKLNILQGIEASHVDYNDAFTYRGKDIRSESPDELKNLFRVVPSFRQIETYHEELISKPGRFYS
jgi:hypothetical protein